MEKAHSLYNTHCLLSKHEWKFLSCSCIMCFLAKQAVRIYCFVKEIRCKGCSHTTPRCRGSGGSVPVRYPGEPEYAHVCAGLESWAPFPPQVRLMSSIKIGMKMVFWNSWTRTIRTLAFEYRVKLITEYFFYYCSWQFFLLNQLCRNQPCKVKWFEVANGHCCGESELCMSVMPYMLLPLKQDRVM